MKCPSRGCIAFLLAGVLGGMAGTAWAEDPAPAGGAGAGADGDPAQAHPGGSASSTRSERGRRGCAAAHIEAAALW